MRHDDAGQSQEEEQHEGDLAGRHVQTEKPIPAVKRDDDERHEPEGDVRPEPGHHRRAKDRKALLPRALAERIGEHAPAPAQSRRSRSPARATVCPRTVRAKMSESSSSSPPVWSPSAKMTTMRPVSAAPEQPREGALEPSELARDLGRAHPCWFLGSSPMTMPACPNAAAGSSMRNAAPTGHAVTQA